MSEQNLKATVVYNPFDLSDRTDALLAFEAGKSLDAYIEGLPDNVSWSIALNGREIDVRMAHLVFPSPDDHVLVMPTPEGGGGGDGKAVLAMVATITLSIFAPQMAPALLQGLGVTATTTALNVASAAISITGGLLINAFLPAPQTADNDADAATYGIDGPKNVSTENIPVPVLYGRHAFGGNFIDLYTENDTDASGNSIQYLYARTLISEGPIAEIEEDTIKLNDQAIDSYSNVEIDYSLGTDTPAPAPWFNAVRNMVNQGVAIKEGEVRSYTTSADVEGFRLDVVAPGGLYKRNSDGDLKGRDVTLQIRYRAEGETEWRNLRTVGGWGATGATVTAAKVTFATRDRFKVTARLSTDLETESLIGSTLQYRAVGETVWRELAMDAEEALLGSRRVVLRAEEIVPEMGNPTTDTNFEMRILDPQGAIIDLSAAGQSIAISTPTEQGTNCHFGAKKTTAVRRSFTSPKLTRATYEIEYTREDFDGEGYDGGSTIMGQAQCSDIAEITYEDLRLPHSAWLGIKVRLDDQLNSIPTLTAVAKGIEMPIYDHEGKQVDYAWSDNPADISLDAYLNRRYGGSVDPEQINWADYADWRDHCVDNDLTFNGLFYESSDIDAAQKHIYTAGRAQRVVSGTTLGVTVERDSMPVMTFGDGNIQTGTLEVGYIGFTDRINDLAITFTNEDDDFAKDTMRFTNDAALNRGDPLKSTNIELKGITKSDRIAREGKLRMNMNRLIRRTANWYAPIEGIGCTVGSVVNLQTRMLDWAEGGRLRSGSAGTAAILDKPFTFEEGESYQLLVHRATKQVDAADVISQAGNLITLDTEIPVTTNVKRIVVGSTEYAVTRIIRYQSSTDVLLGSDVSALNLVGLSATLWDTDVLETIDVDPMMTIGTTETVHLLGALPGDAVYSNYMLGKTTAKKRLFRIKTLGRTTSDGYIKLTAVEHVPEVYDDTAEIVLQPRPVSQNHVSNLAASVRAERGEGAMKLLLDVSWSTLDITYTGARVDVAVDQGRFETFTTTGGNSVEIPVEKGHSYTVRVTALQANGGTPPAAQVSTVGYADGPGVPEGLTATPGYRSLELGWTKSAIGSTTSYEIVLTKDPALVLDEATEVSATSVSSEYTFSGMGDFSDHYVAVRAIDAYNNRSDWTALEKAAPKATIGTGDVEGIPDVPAATPAPTDLSLSTELVSDGVSKITVAWTAPAGAEPVGYELRMREGAGAYSSIQTSELTYELRVTPGAAMIFSVRAVYAYSATSDYTDELGINAAKDTTPPAAPANLTSKDGVGSIWLLWDANTESDLAHYEVAEKVGSSTPAANTTAILTKTTATTLAHQLEKGLTRYYWVRAVDTSGNKSDWSNMVTAKSIDVSEEIQKSLDDATWTADVGFVKHVTGETLPTTNVGETISFGGKLYTWDGTAYAPTVKMDELTFENVTGSVSKGQLGTDVSDFIEQQGVTASADKAAAEQAAADALAAANAAAGAQEISESARDTSVAAKDLAETAKGAAEQAQADAEAAQSGAVSAKSAAETARDAAQSARNLAQTAQGGAEDAQTAAESAQSLAEGARDAAATARDLSQSARDASQTARDASQTAQSNAETAQGLAEQARDAAAGSATSASDSSTLAANAASDAGDSADAAATSESNAAASASDAGQQASAADTARVAAETARSGAETAEGNAATSASDAASSEAAASNYSALSARAQQRGEFAAMGRGTISPQYVVDTSDYAIAVFQDGTEVFLNGTPLATLDRGDLPTFSLTAGDRITATGPVSLTNGESHTAVPEVLAGTQFFTYYDRNTPVTVTVVPLASGSYRFVEQQDSPGIYEALQAEAWADMVEGVPFTITLGSTLSRAHVLIETTTPVVASRRSSGADRDSMLPAHPEVMVRSGGKYAAFGPDHSIVVTNFPYVYSSDGVTPVGIAAYADGNGTDCEAAMPVPAMGDTYVLAQTHIGDYKLMALETTTVTVTDKDGTVLGEHVVDCSAGPASVEIGTQAGNGSVISTNGPFYFSAPGVFALRTNKNTYEYAAVGFQRRYLGTDASAAANAAVVSASTASAKADEAGESATAAQSAQIAAETAQGKAETAESNAAQSETNAAGSASSASSSATVAADAATEAGDQASAASNSASAASASATTAGQKATAAENSATAAETARGQAQTSADEAAVSATNADGSASEAAASRKDAVEASVASVAHAGGNIFPVGTFDHAPARTFYEYFNGAAAADAPAGHPLGRTRALKQTIRDARAYPSLTEFYIHQSPAGRRFRISGYIYNASDARVQIGINGQDSDGTSYWHGTQAAPAADNQWREFSVELNIGSDWTWKNYRPWMQIDGLTGTDYMECYWTDLVFEDVTESATAEDAAAAAVTSESNAAASADEAGQQAIAADEARVAAQTAQGHAETAETNAASSESNASGSASEAASSATVAAGAKAIAVQLSGNPVFALKSEGFASYAGWNPSGQQTEFAYGTEITDSVTGDRAYNFAQGTIQFLDLVPFDPARTYRLKIRIRANTSNCKIHFGVMQFDATGADVITVGGTNRVWEQQGDAVAQGDWIELSHVIGAGGRALTPGTAQLRPVLLMNYQLSGQSLDVDEFRLEDITESVKAEDAAVAAAISESNAAASATEAGEEAASATIAKNLAETAQGYAEAAEERAATSETNALGSESAAAASETVAANASREASQSAGANLLPFSTVEVADVKYGDYLAGNIFVTDDIPAGHPLGRTKAIKQTNRPGYIAMSQEDAWVQSSLGGRIFKVSGYVYNASTAQARMGVHYKRADNSSSWPTGTNPAAEANSNEWTYFEQHLEFGEGHESVRWQGWIHINGQDANGDTFEAYWTDLRIEDVTEQRRASQSANAAATSESNAAASATEAGEQASAAQTARTGAETARSGAETAQTNASQSATDADGAASSAASSATAAADSANEAGDSASAASESASLASTKATEAGTQADAAQTARTGAETARGGAETAESNAASSASDAAGSANAASSSATVAAEVYGDTVGAAKVLFPAKFSAPFFVTAVNNFNATGPWDDAKVDPVSGAAMLGPVNETIGPLGLIALEPGHVYEVEVTTEVTGTENVYTSMGIQSFDASGTLVDSNKQAVHETLLPGGGVVTRTFRIGDSSAGGSRLISYSAGAVFLRPHMRFNPGSSTSGTALVHAFSVRDVTDVENAAAAAAAAATSESNASASENAAGQFADAAEIAKTGAETARSGAETAEYNASQSETTATGAASSAVSSASLAAKASSRALERAVGNLIADGNFVQSTLEWANFTTGLLVTRYDHTGTQPDTDFSMSLKAGVAGLGMGYARQAPSEVLKTMRGRTLRITGWGNTANAGKAIFGFRTINDDNSLKSYVTVELMPARQNWTWVDQLIELPDNYAEVHSILLGAEFTDLNDVAYFTQLTLEDVTESQSAADSAAASADSATTAAASADEAGQSASAADTARLAAETAQGYAEAAEGRAATSENNADMSASEASGYSTLAATAQSRAASVNMGRGIIGPQIVAFSDNYLLTAYQDGTDVYRNGAYRLTVNRGDMIGTLWFDAGDVITTTGPVSFSNTKSILPIPTAFAGDKFFTYWSRYTPITLHVVPLASGKYRYVETPGPTEPYPLLADEAWADMVEGVPFTITVGSEIADGHAMVETTSPVVMARVSSGGDYDSVPPMWPEVLYNGSQAYRAFGNGGVKVNNPMMTGMVQGEPVMAVGIGDGAGSDCEHAMPVAMAGDTYVIAENFIDDYWIAATEETVVRITDKDGLLRGEHTIGSGKQPGAYQYGSRSGQTTTQITNGPFFVTGDKPFALRTNTGGDREYMVYGFRRAFLGSDASAQVNAAISYAAQASAYSDEAGDQASAAEASRLAAETAWGGAELAESNAATSESNAAGSASSASTSQAITARARAQAQVQAGGNLMPISTFEDAGIDYSVWLPNIISVADAPAGHPLGRKKAIHQTERSGYMPMLEDGYYITEQLEGRTFKISGWIYNDGNVSAGAGVTYRTASDGSNRWRTVSAAPANSNEWVFYEDTLTFEDGLDQKDWRGWLFLNGWSSDGDNMSAYWTDIRIEDVTESVAAEAAASAAATSESNASASETAAGEAAEAADASALAAGTSASNALASEGRTATSETNAAGSASAASESATLAADAADAAGDSAQAAALSESNASSSATDSANSADASASSALVATAAKERAVQLTGNPVFEFEGESFASYSGWNPSGTHTDFTYGDEIADPVTGGRAYNFGFGTIQFLELVPFDPMRTYRMKVRIRANTAACQIHFGFQRFDALGAELPANNNRYWRWSASPVTQGDWVEYEFEFGATGVAVAAGTALIRPMLLMNHGRADESMDLDEFRLEDVTESVKASKAAADALVYRDDAVQAKVDAEAAESNASTKAGLAAQAVLDAENWADAASDSSTTASGHASDALSYAEAAESNALSAEASRRRADEGAVGTLVRDGFFEEGTLDWVAHTSGIAVSRHNHSGPDPVGDYSLRVYRSTLDGAVPSYARQDAGEHLKKCYGRTLRLTGWVNCANTGAASIGFRRVNADNSLFDYQVAEVRPAGSSAAWAEFDVQIEIPNDGKRIQSILAGAELLAVGDSAYFTDLVITDVTVAARAEEAEAAAVIAKDGAVSAKEDAESAEGRAASSETLATRSAWKAAAAAGGNLIWKSTYEDGVKGGWTSGQVVDAPAGHPLGRTKAVKISIRDTYHWVDPTQLSGETFFTSDLTGRTLRFSGWVYNLSAVQARAGINYRGATGNNNWPTSLCADANSGEWVYYEFTLSFSTGYGGVKWRPFFQLNGTTGSDYMETYWTDVSIEDVTESQKAADSAANAQISADAAAQSYSDADGAASVATQQAGLAADAVTAAGDQASAANDSAASAASSADEAGTQAEAAESSRLAAEAAYKGTPLQSLIPDRWLENGGTFAGSINAFSPAGIGKRFGTSVVYLGAGGDFPTFIDLDTTVEPGEAFSWGVWIYHEVAGSPLGQIGFPGNGGWARSPIPEASSEWQFVQGSGIAPSGANALRLELRTPAAGLAGALYLDGAIIVRGQHDLSQFTVDDTAATKAAAASTSASQASASADAAGQSASAASDDALTATTQAGYALSRAGAAADSASAAATSESNASNYRNLAALAMSGGGAKNPVFAKWGTNYPLYVDSYLQNGSIVQASGKYGNAVDLISPNNTALGPYLGIDRHNTFTPFTFAPKLLVTLELELLSGNPGGVSIDVGWHDGTDWTWETRYIGSGLIYGAGVQTIQFYIERPAGVNTGGDVVVRLFSSRNAAGGSLQVVSMRVHRFDWQVVATDSLISEQMTTKATVDGIAEAAYVLRAKAGGASAGLELVAADDPVNGPASALRVNADEIILNGSVKTPHLGAGIVTAGKLFVGDLTNIHPNGDFLERPGDYFQLEVASQPNGQIQNLWAADYGGTGKYILNLQKSPAGIATSLAAINPSTFAVGDDEELHWETRIKGVGASASAGAYVQVQWWDAQGNYLGAQSLLNNKSFNGAWARYSGSFTPLAGAASGRIRLLNHSSQSTAQNLLYDYVRIRRKADGELIVNGTITATHMVQTEAVITNSAQIGNAIIDDAHITELSAAKLIAGTAIAGNIVVAGQTAANLASWAYDPSSRINSGPATTIVPGKIRIKGDGSTTLDDWIGSDQTSIDGGKIETDTILARMMRLYDQENLYPDGGFYSGDLEVYSVSKGASGTGYAVINTNPAHRVSGVASLVLTKVDLTDSVSVTTDSTKRSLAPVIGGQDYWLETEAKTGGTPMPAGFYCRVRWYDADKNYISQEGCAENQPLTADWRAFSKQVTAPPNAAFAGFQVWNHSSQTVTYGVYVDRIVLRRANAASLVVEGSLNANVIGAGLISADFLNINNLLVLDEAKSGFSMGKASANDQTSDGIYLGRTNDGGTLGFGLLAGRIANDEGYPEYIQATKSGGLRMVNAKHYRDLTALTPPVMVTSSQTITLSASTTRLSLEIQGGGSGGAAGGDDYWLTSGDPATGKAGGTTTVKVYDGSTLKATYTAAGGAEVINRRSANDGGWGEDSAFASGGRDGDYSNGNGQAGSLGSGGGGGGGGTGGHRGGDKGKAGALTTRTDIDVSGYSNPKITITIGGGGAGGTSSAGNGGKGGNGCVRYSAQVAKQYRADVVPLEPTAYGQMSSHGPFPNLGAGLWILSVQTNIPIDMGLVSINGAGAIHPSQDHLVSFVSNKTPVVMTTPYTARTISYQFFKMGD